MFSFLNKLLLIFSARINFLKEKEKLLSDIDELELQYMVQVEWLEQLCNIPSSDPSHLQQQIDQCKVCFYCLTYKKHS